MAEQKNNTDKARAELQAKVEQNTHTARELGATIDTNKRGTTSARGMAEQTASNLVLHMVEHKFVRVPAGYDADAIHYACMVNDGLAAVTAPAADGGTGQFKFVTSDMRDAFTSYADTSAGVELALYKMGCEIVETGLSFPSVRKSGAVDSWQPEQSSDTSWQRLSETSGTRALHRLAGLYLCDGDTGRALIDANVKRLQEAESRADVAERMMVQMQEQMRQMQEQLAALQAK